MGTGSSESQTQEGSASTDSEAANKVRRSVREKSRRSSARLSKTRDFERVQRSGRRTQLPLITVWKTRGLTLQPRVGIVVGLHGRSAVARNRLKRRVRYIVRSEILTKNVEAFDAVIRIQPAAYAATFHKLRTCLIEAFSS
jgi:ribonuclease P protein component